MAHHPAADRQRRVGARARSANELQHPPQGCETASARAVQGSWGASVPEGGGTRRRREALCIRDAHRRRGRLAREGGAGGTFPPRWCRMAGDGGERRPVAEGRRLRGTRLRIRRPAARRCGDPRGTRERDELPDFWQGAAACRQGGNAGLVLVRRPRAASPQGGGRALLGGSRACGVRVGVRPCCKPDPSDAETSDGGRFRRRYERDAPFPRALRPRVQHGGCRF